ncbi:hypothetical protein PF010_g6641 [Phytophthora fragariae]|uniref:Uncharacterized protein n=1 Tax=Phytophthora fragariae TaxID=53985 RepID=A0A6A3SW23_9STRA|nr:hypothetical protein PF003_g29457 [Phytophthora fragariae]KAE8942086.1 hypothetical protein PF009_g8141 [Phytophthora fragariae]KAE9121697.1 hypothetical protein PF007_g7724 [Phytophthora fragariae]KAE9122735.1 hypothetical protein PF010_g6641 [Phytophthora fragariae]KAE9148949.1 hypothetical protein PF006_g6512 [Phytophthora fragariae]
MVGPLLQTRFEWRHARWRIVTQLKAPDIVREYDEPQFVHLLRRESVLQDPLNQDLDCSTDFIITSSMPFSWGLISLQVERVTTCFVISVSGELLQLPVHVDPEGGQQVSADDVFVVINVHHETWHSLCGLDGPGSGVNEGVQQSLRLGHDRVRANRQALHWCVKQDLLHIAVCSDMQVLV